MKVYIIPPDIREKEKVVGGVLDLNQLFWISVGLVLGLIVFALTFKALGGVGSIFLSILICPIGLPFAFYKKNNLSLYEYLKRKKKFKKKNKKMPNKRREETKWELFY